MTVYVSRLNMRSERFAPTIMNILVDDSRSMTPMREKSIVTCALNEVTLPAIKGTQSERKTMLRISLGAFSDDKVQSLTPRPGYYTIDELMRKDMEIKNDRFGKLVGLDGNTALYASIISGIHSIQGAAKVIRDATTYKKLKSHLIVMTDGENCTENPTTPKDVQNAIESVESYLDLKVHLAYFKTGVSIDRHAFERIAGTCGIPKNQCHFWADHGNSIEQQKKAFRRFAMIPSTLV